MTLTYLYLKVKGIFESIQIIKSLPKYYFALIKSKSLYLALLKYLIKMRKNRNIALILIYKYCFNSLSNIASTVFHIFFDILLHEAEINLNSKDVWIIGVELIDDKLLNEECVCSWEREIAQFNRSLRHSNNPNMRLLFATNKKMSSPMLPSLLG